MPIKNVLDFVTYKERLKHAEDSMMLAYYDYLDNTGNSDAREFWRDFEKARGEWQAIRDEVKEDESTENKDDSMD
jgi:hypothetical protein